MTSEKTNSGRRAAGDKPIKLTENAFAKSSPQREAVVREALAESVLADSEAASTLRPIEQIDPSPYQVRPLVDSAINDLAESIQATGGLVSPIIVRPLNGRYEVIAGHTRLAAYRRLGYDKIPTLARRMTDAEAAQAVAADNFARTDLTDYQTSKQLAVLFTNGFVRTNSEAARLLGCSRRDVIRLQKFDQLPEAVHECLGQHPDLISASTAEALVDLLGNGREQLVIEGVQLLAKEELKNQTALLKWIEKSAEAKPKRPDDYRLHDRNGKVYGKIKRTSSGLTITGSGIDLEALESFLRDEGSRFFKP